MAPRVLSIWALSLPVSAFTGPHWQPPTKTSIACPTLRSILSRTLGQIALVALLVAPQASEASVYCNLTQLGHQLVGTVVDLQIPCQQDSPCNMIVCSIMLPHPQVRPTLTEPADGHPQVMDHVVTPPHEGPLSFLHTVN